MISSVEIADPKFDDDVEHDVVARCPNGKIQGRSSAPIYVVIRIDFDDEGTDADVVAYSYDTDLGCTFIETIAARTTFGKFWNFKTNGSPCFDPICDDGSVRDPPNGRFMMWDEIEQDDADVPDTTKASLTIYDLDETGSTNSKPKYKPIQRYKLCIAQPTINDYVAIETTGDKFFLT